MPKAFKVHKPCTKKESKDLQQVKAFAKLERQRKEEEEEDADADVVSLSSEEERRDILEVQRRLQRFLRVATFFTAVLMCVLVAVSIACHFLLGSGPGLRLRQRAERYGTQFICCALYVLLLGGYLVWVHKKGAEGISASTALFLGGEYVFGLSIFVFLYYDRQTATLSVAIISSVVMTAFNVLAIFAWSVPERTRLPTIRSWIIILISVMTGDACVITTLLVHFQLPDCPVVLAWLVAMINLTLLISLTKILFRHLIFNDSLLESEESRKRRRKILQVKIPFVLSWQYVYPAVTSYSLFLFVIIVFALLLHFPRIAANFEESRKPYHAGFNQTTLTNDTAS